MRNICTLSDDNYLAKGLALWRSLGRDSFKMYYLCLDDQSYTKLKLSGIWGVVPISLRKLEAMDENLRAAKANRPYNQYCWTLASYFMKWLMNNYEMDSITYIDSDIFFYQSIEPFYKEIDDKSIGIIAHRHNSVGESVDGAFNVGVIYFKNNEKGNTCLNWWQDAVINKKYPHLATCGDQKYLEDFIPRFGEEHVQIVDKTIGHGAPWNYRLYQYDKLKERGCITWGGKNQPFLFNHFSRFSYDLGTDQINYTSGCYRDHTLNNKVFEIPEVHQLYVDYYKVLKQMHKDLSRLSAPAYLKPTKVAFGMIVFEGDYVLKESIESVYPFASQILIAEGPVKYWQDKGRTTSTDRTNEILDTLHDPRGIIQVTHGQYSEKDEQCNAYMNNLDADYIWNLDSDEVYKEEDLEVMMSILKANEYTSYGMQSCSFYGGFNKYITGFEEEKDQFLRIFKSYPGSKWKTHRPPTVTIPGGVTPLKERHCSSEFLYEGFGIRMYHYSYVFPRQVANKVNYYKDALTKSKCVDNYFGSIYLPWVTGNMSEKKMIELKNHGVHEYKPQYRRPTFTEYFEGRHPKPIERNIEKLKAELLLQLRAYPK